VGEITKPPALINKQKRPSEDGRPFLFKANIDDILEHAGAFTSASSLSDNQ
jgi:hypothetical protein